MGHDLFFLSYIILVELKLNFNISIINELL